MKIHKNPLIKINVNLDLKYFIKNISNYNHDLKDCVENIKVCIKNLVGTIIINIIINIFINFIKSFSILLIIISLDNIIINIYSFSVFITFNEEFTNLPSFIMLNSNVRPSRF